MQPSDGNIWAIWVIFTTLCIITKLKIIIGLEEITHITHIDLTDLGDIHSLSSSNLIQLLSNLKKSLSNECYWPLSFFLAPVVTPLLHPIMDHVFHIRWAGIEDLLQDLLGRF